MVGAVIPNTMRADKIRENITIIIDSREKVNAHITRVYDLMGINYIIKKLDFGDYSFSINVNGENYDYSNIVSFERKSGLQELASNITRGRKAFEAEYARHKGNMFVVIEDNTYNDLITGNYENNVSKESFIGTMHTWQRRYGVPFLFIEKKDLALYMFYTFFYYAKEDIEKGRIG